ncbi:MAG: GGDEF domain-containing protein [Epsilonproteobacteria bacterium]|nr:GGDEF domain-containing protein [Campylobacterota bacterium]
MREKKEGVLVVLDIDDFKKVNDTYGHQIGDKILKEFATLIQDNIRGDDLFARWGGEEFLLLLENTNVYNAIINFRT